MNTMNQNVPQEVAIVYRNVGNTHVFTSKGIEGLVHCGSAELEDAFSQVIHCLNHHVTEVYGCEVEYKCETPFDEFKSHVEKGTGIVDSFFTLKLDTLDVACH